MSHGGQGGKTAPMVDDEPDFTAMIDMTFMLLAFFIVSSTMKVGSSLKLPPAQTGDSVGTKGSTIITVLYADQTPEIYLADGNIGGAQPISEVVGYVSEGIAKQKPNVLIKADRQTPAGFVEEVARAAGQVEGVQQFYLGVTDYSM